MTGDQHRAESGGDHVLKMAFVLPTMTNARLLLRGNQRPELFDDFAASAFQPCEVLQQPRSNRRAGGQPVAFGDQHREGFFEKPPMIDPVGRRRRAADDRGVHRSVKKHFHQPIGGMLHHVDAQTRHQPRDFGERSNDEAGGNARRQSDLQWRNVSAPKTFRTEMCVVRR